MGLFQSAARKAIASVVFSRIVMASPGMCKICSRMYNDDNISFPRASKLQVTSDANDFVNAKSHAREKPLHVV